MLRVVLLLYSLLSSYMETRDHTFCTDIFASVTDRRPRGPLTFDFALPAVETGRLFACHSYTSPHTRLQAPTCWCPL
jgi:hypothetical protein